MYADSVPSAESVPERGQPLPSGGPRCTYVHPARADCVYMQGRQPEGDTLKLLRRL